MSIPIEDNLYNIAISLANDNKIENSIECFNLLLKINPNHIDSLFDLGAIYSHIGNKTKALEYAYRVNSIEENYKNILTHIGNTLCSLGKYKEAIQTFEKGLEINPYNLQIWSDLLLSFNYLNIPQIEKKYYYDKLYEMTKPLVSDRKNNYRHKKLKLGYISSDFRNHAVAYFTKGVITKHNKELFDVYYYSNSPISDKITESFKESGIFKQIFNLSDHELYNEILKDEIDILIDLNGHTQNNRVGVFLMKPSDVQISWLGFMNTMGIATIDYKISDVDLFNGKDSDYYEKVKLIEKSLSYSPPEIYPDIKELPFDKNGNITFGYFNNHRKITDDVVKAWNTIFKELPHSNFHIIESDGYSILKEKLDIYHSDRVKIITNKDLYGFMDDISNVDVCLDPFPHTGGATTSHAIWMGVPTISIKGNYEFERLSSTLLKQVNLNEFIANSIEEYIYIAKNLNVDLLRKFRLNSRYLNKFDDKTIRDIETFFLELFSFEFSDN
jgi:protein O-GlcNAc transferase